MFKRVINFLKKISTTMDSISASTSELVAVNQRLNQMNEVLVDLRINGFINDDSKELNNELNKFEYQVYSQNGEDGLLDEILNRLSIQNGIFVEIGVQDGLETNSTFLLMQGWSGIWVEADKNYCNKINTTFKKELSDKSLRLVNEFVKEENINSIFDQEHIPNDFEVLSIDIDSNDYWVWAKITSRPKIVIIEYNAFIPPPKEWVMTYDSNKVWDDSTVFNSSLQSLKNLGERKGYRLVACCANGVNAFFVREDLINEKFPKRDIKDIYQPIRYYLKRGLTINKGFQKND